MTRKFERKWVIGQSDRFGPCEELVTLIPSAFSNEDEDNWYFVWSAHRAVSAKVVFDTPQTAALAAIELNQEKIHRLENENKRFLDWYNELEQQRKEVEQEVTTT